MTIEIRWNGGNIQTLSGLPDDCPLFNKIKDGSIFEQVQVFIWHGNVTALNLTFAESITILDEQKKKAGIA